MKSPKNKALIQLLILAFLLVFFTALVSSTASALITARVKDKIWNEYYTSMLDEVKAGCDAKVTAAVDVSRTTCQDNAVKAQKSYADNLKRVTEANEEMFYLGVFALCDGWTGGARVGDCLGLAREARDIGVYKLYLYSNNWSWEFVKGEQETY